MKKLKYKTTGLITGLDSRRFSVKLSYVLMIAFMVLVCIIAILPVAWAALSGFKDLDEFYSVENFSFLPKTFDIAKLKYVMEDMTFGISVANSLFLVVVAILLQIVVGGIAGYTISRLKPKGSGFLFNTMLWVMVMPGAIMTVPCFMMWTNFPIIHVNFMNTYVPLLLGHCCGIFNILLFKNFFDGIPNSLIEAAKIDGCTDAGIFFRIVAPLSKPIISTISVFVFNGVWNEFKSSYLYLKNSSLHTVALKLYLLKSQWDEPQQLLAAFIVMIPSLIVFIICARQIMGNSTAAAVKE